MIRHTTLLAVLLAGLSCAGQVMALPPYAEPGEIVLQRDVPAHVPYESAPPGQITQSVNADAHQAVIDSLAITKEGNAVTNALSSTGAISTKKDQDKNGAIVNPLNTLTNTIVGEPLVGQGGDFHGMPGLTGGIISNVTAPTMSALGHGLSTIVNGALAGAGGGR
jgi:hypothetical protein